MARILRTVQWVSIGLGVSLLTFYFGVRLQNSASAAQEVARFEETQRSMVAAQASHGDSTGVDSGLDPALPDPDMTLWDEGRIAKYEESLEHEFDLPLGVLRIAAIDLVVPVLSGTSDLTLDRAVGHIDGTSRLDESGNVGIAGHRDGFFRSLKDVSVGDRIEIETLSTRQVYVISEISVVEPDAVHVLDPTPSPAVTLVTCYPFYYAGSAPQRYIVRAVPVDDNPSPPDGQPADVADSLSDASGDTPGSGE